MRACADPLRHVWCCIRMYACGHPHTNLRSWHNWGGIRFCGRTELMSCFTVLIHSPRYTISPQERIPAVVYISGRIYTIGA